VDVGSSYLLSELAAAFLWAQLEHANEITARRLAIWQAYQDALAPLEELGVRRPVVPADCVHNAHLYYLLLPHPAVRPAFLAGLKELGVQSVFHYVPLHTSPGGERFARAAGDLAVTDRQSARLIRLPVWVGMTDAQVRQVIAAVTATAQRLLSATRASSRRAA
jgi:dTDP-4-amino-4,6-dideoxygalactose transaminase